jgi:hypothetical protein
MQQKGCENCFQSLKLIRNWSLYKTDRHINKYSYSLMRRELIIFPHVRSKRTKVSNLRSLFQKCFPTQRTYLGKLYYDPKHAVGFGSVAKFVKASKSKKRDVEDSLSGQNAYILHKPVRKQFPWKPYSVTNIDVSGRWNSRI